MQYCNYFPVIQYYYHYEAVHVIYHDCITISVKLTYYHRTKSVEICAVFV